MDHQENNQNNDQRGDARRAEKSRRNRKWLGTGLALSAAAVFVDFKKRQAEWKHPPQGRFIYVDGVRLHYVERGSGTPLVLLHGAFGMASDFCMSGLVELAAKHYRVIVFDRPGYGYSERPRKTFWGPKAQAKLIHDALEQLEVKQALVLGHSWGTLVALAMALDYPGSVRALVLASGYYYPSLRPDLPIAAQRLVPVLGDIMRHTTTPIMMRLLWPLFAKRMFQPNEVPRGFKDFPVWMAARPLQVRASAEEFTYAIPSVMGLRKRYRHLQQPLVIVAGSEDRMAYVSGHSERLHTELPGSELRLIPGVGHMVHHVAPDTLMEAIDAAMQKSESFSLAAPHAQERSAARMQFDKRTEPQSAIRP